MLLTFSGRSKSQVKSKVRPPRLGGEKVGLFATRTPHRPNPIGLSLVKLDRIKDGCVPSLPPSLPLSLPLSQAPSQGESSHALAGARGENQRLPSAFARSASTST